MGSEVAVTRAAHADAVHIEDAIHAGDGAGDGFLQACGRDVQ